MCDFVAKGRLSIWFAIRHEMNHFNHYNWNKMLSVNSYSYKSESIEISCQDSCLALQWCFGNQKTDTDNVKKTPKIFQWNHENLWNNDTNMKPRNLRNML